VLNLNSTGKKLLEGFIINNINNETSYGKHNILVNTCKPMNNWRSSSEKVKNMKVVLSDESVFIDEIKLNNLVDSVFKKLPSLTATLLKKNSFNEVSKTEVAIQKDLKMIEFAEIDLIDMQTILNKILSVFGIVSKDFNNYYNLICDGNSEYVHNSNDVREELYNKVRLELMKKGII
jgi:hypothetical protein